MENVGKRGDHIKRTPHCVEKADVKLEGDLLLAKKQLIQRTSNLRATLQPTSKARSFLTCDGKYEMRGASVGRRGEAIIRCKEIV